MYLAHIKRSEAGDEGPLFWGGGLALGRDDASTRLAKNNLTNARLRRGPLKKEKGRCKERQKNIRKVAK